MGREKSLANRDIAAPADRDLAQKVARAAGEANLRQAEQAVPRDDRETWADLQNAWGGLCYRKGDLAAAVDHHWQGWLAAKKINHVEQQMKAAHNLGQLYVELGR
jgi:hypothetical protein